MSVDLNELVKDALELEIPHAAIADTTKINFYEEVRDACVKNYCGKFNTNWMGPPAIGPVSELKIKASRFKQGLLFQTVHQLEDSMDYEGMINAGKIHEEAFRKLLDHIKTKYQFQDMLPLNAGCCSICPKCTYLDNEPCRNPSLAVASVEAYGIDVMALVKDNGIPYNNGKNTVSYVGLILFNENE